MRSRTEGYAEIEYFQGNMMDTDLPEKSFDAIIDKALFDSLICSHLGEVECNIYVQEVYSMQCIYGCWDDKLLL